MDPRKPELAVSRMRELMEQFDNVMSRIKVAEVSNKLGEMEREGSLVIQEICLVAPRLHEAMMQASRTRRFTLSRGFTIEDAEAREALRFMNEKRKELEEEKPKKRGRKKKAE